MASGWYGSRLPRTSNTALAGRGGGGDFAQAGLRLAGDGGGDQAVVLRAKMEPVAGQPGDLSAAEGNGRLELVAQIDQVEMRVGVWRCRLSSSVPRP